MSENNENQNPAIVSDISEPISDLSLQDMENIQKYVDEGLPGIARVDETMLARIMDLYLSGKTYTQIARAMRINRTVIIYLSNKFNWHVMRREFLSELESTIRARVVEARVVSQDFMLQLAHVWESKMGNKIQQYIATGNEAILNEIDLKEVDKYLKIVDFMHKVGETKKGGDKPPTVGLNLGEGVTVEKISDSKVEITPKQNIIKNKLKEFAAAARKEAEDKNTIENDEE